MKFLQYMSTFTRNKLTFIPIEFLRIDNNEFVGSTNGTRIVVFFFIHRRQNIRKLQQQQ